MVDLSVIHNVVGHALVTNVACLARFVAVPTIYSSDLQQNGQSIWVDDFVNKSVHDLVSLRYVADRVDHDSFRICLACCQSSDFC